MIAPRLPIILLPAVCHTLLIVFRNVDVHEIDACSRLCLGEANYHDRVRIGLLPLGRPPSLHDHLFRNDQKVLAFELAAECSKGASSFAADFGWSASRPRMLLRIHVKLIKNFGQDTELY